MAGKTQTGRKPLRLETNILKEIQSKLSAGYVRLFRNNVGAAWMGPFVRKGDGSVVLVKPQRVVFGLCEGSSDLIGWRSITITQDMVGQRFAQFVAVEVKNSTGKLSKVQGAFLLTVAEAGGRAGVARSVTDAVHILAGASNVDSI
jgi:hypothetical protein